MLEVKGQKVRLFQKTKMDEELANSFLMLRGQPFTFLSQKHPVAYKMVIVELANVVYLNEKKAELKHELKILREEKRKLKSIIWKLKKVKNHL